MVIFIYEYSVFFKFNFRDSVSLEVTANIRVLTRVLKCILRSGTQEQTFNCGSIVNSAFWHSKIASSLRFYAEICILAFKYDFIAVLLRSIKNNTLRSGIQNLSFHLGSIVNSTLWHSSIVFSIRGPMVNSALWRSQIMFPLRFYNCFCALTLTTRTEHLN